MTQMFNVSQAQALIDHLGRGGTYGHVWENPPRKTTWYSTDDGLPSIHANGSNVYFGVHPVGDVPTVDRDGNPRPSSAMRSRNDLVVAANCLYGDFDAKDFDDKAAALAHIKALPEQPTVVVDSGGGYHAYWLTDQTWHLESDEQRADLMALQTAWVQHVGCDEVKDLARLLRLPGTVNHKYPDKPLVTILWSDGPVYDWASLAEPVADIMADNAEAERALQRSRAERAAQPSDSVIAQFNADNDLVDLLTAAGYTITDKRGGTYRLSRPGQPDSKGMIVWADEQPQACFAFSSNDPLYDMAGHAHDAFDVYSTIEHGGDKSAAYETVKRALGLWVDDDQVESIIKQVQDKQRAADEADEAADDDGDDEAAGGKKRISQADRLFVLAQQQCQTFHDLGSTYSYAVVTEFGVRKTYRIQSLDFRAWLNRLWQASVGKTISKSAIEQVKDALIARTSESDWVYVRTAQLGDDIYIDLGDDSWQVVKVNAQGWQLVDSSDVPVIFYRSRDMQALPRPERDGNIAELFDFLNVDDVCAKLLAVTVPYMLLPSGPFPVLLMTGEKGSAKSTGMRVIQRLVDPRKGGMRQMIAKPEDVMIYASNSWLLSYENVSRIDDATSDALCSVATGGGFGKRELYSDTEEVTFEAKRPVMLNGIYDFVNRPDLMDRAVPVTMQRIPREKRMTEGQFWRKFDEAQGRIFGAVLDVLVTALAGRDSVHLDKLPRLADFAIFGAAAEAALPEHLRGFVAELFDAQETSAVAIAESSPLTAPVVRFVASRPGRKWQGTASDLLEQMDLWFSAVDARQHKPATWPRTAATLGTWLTEQAPVWRDTGIMAQAERHNRLDGKRKVWVFEAPDDADGSFVEVPGFSG